MVQTVFIEDVLKEDISSRTILDVRSPSEYLQGHIPHAINLPLFTDDERAAVGIAYKNAGPEHAMKLGLALVGPKMEAFVLQAKELAQDKPCILHCWRGGKRSESMAWLLDFAGMPISVLRGGYKAYRTFLHAWLHDTAFNLIILGGKTGSGKTDILHRLRAYNEQVLDLEKLACHKGSAFGWIGEEEQPSNEQFENALFHELYSMDPAKRIWVENESKSIGRIYIPDMLWVKMKTAPLMNLEIATERRVKNLVESYASGNAKEALISSFLKISDRLGYQHAKEAVGALEANDYQKAAEIALVYYDKAYYYGLEQSMASVIEQIDAGDMPIDQIAQTLVTHAEQMHPQLAGI